MKKLLSCLSMMVLLMNVLCGFALSEDIIELSFPDNMPDDYLQYYWIGGYEKAALHSLLKAQIVMLIPLRSKYCSYQTMITRRSSIIKWNIHLVMVTLRRKKKQHCYMEKNF